MLTIRMTRVGKKKQPTYRIVVQDRLRDPWGKAIAIVGHYNPRTNPKTLVLKADVIKEWLSKGAQPSASVHNLLVDQKLISGEKKRSSPGKKKEKKK